MVKARSALLPLFCLPLFLLLIACQSVPAPLSDASARPVGSALPDWPPGRLFQIDAQASELRIVVRAAGRLARFGHPHVLGGPALEGRVLLAEDWQSSAFELAIRVRDLELDHPEWRIDEGFEPELPEGAIEDTRANLLSEAVLDAERHPQISVRSVQWSGPRFQPDVTVRISLRGESRDLSVPISLHLGDDQLIASGRLSLRQSDFGLTPFSALGGALAVADELVVRFRIVALASPSDHNG